MSTATFYMPSMNIIGAGAVEQAVNELSQLGFKQALIVTDKPLVEMGYAQSLQDALAKKDIKSCLFDEVQPNPTVGNVEAGLKLLKESHCDFVISLGGGSPHDCAKGIALVASNGGSIRDYEGVDQSKQAQLPLVAINTTAGTASEVTRFCIITDEQTHIKMAIVDKNVTPIMSVNDPELMKNMPKSLTAATGMDALTHAVEAYVSTAANPITDACALKAVTLISQYLSRAVQDGNDMEARNQMAYAQLLAGMAFNNASLGYVHAMAHQLGGFYDLPHGVCNAILLPHVQRFNSQVASERQTEIANAMGLITEGLTHEQGAKLCIEAIEKLADAVGIPKGLAGLGVKEADLDILTENAMKDACGLTNPIQPSHEQVVAIFKAAF